jgi:hypothetical protein
MGRQIPSQVTMSEQSFYGLREVSCVLTGVSINVPLKTLLDGLFIHQPRLTGWPPWVDSRSFSDAGSRPYVKDRGWEALIYDKRTSWSVKEMDFWRIEPTGRFYAARTYEDDTSKMLLDRGLKPGTVFDFVLLISRTAELIATVRAFVDALKADRNKALLEFAFRWTGLRDRKICCWVEPMRELFSSVTAEDDVVTSTITIPQEAPDNTLWEAVKRVTQPVFDVFGAGVGDPVFQDLVDRTLKRRL